ncbi:LysR substrate-binding domain-containing protein [Paraburkholderia sp. D15]|uniref:LysR substrate-binding domain-containing protein n=1 Tax=Paraburkholderia sp. D15 TaxID=2880218 RepID=UPI00247911B6|nr:LysR substrate-binding domain-containing protein [Paraburkholderia sp. D15]WGS54266.1 LysR substrate-binding domain-containing protein [Paraburkholderia sp. D15]
MSDSLLFLASMMEPMRGFVAVGRRMSITLAAEDLCLTQSALSRQVKALEERLGVKLLTRGHRAIAFTPEGERFFRSASSALQQLQDAVGTVRRVAQSRSPVTLSASIGVTGLWVLPRLGRFQELNPGIDLRVAANNRVLDLAGDGIDLVIRYCPSSAVDDSAVLLFHETIGPVAHPALGIKQVLSPQDLAGQVLLEFDEPGRPWLHWEDWFNSVGWRDVKPKALLRFNQYDQVVQSAMAGQGIALGRLELIKPMIADRRLALLDAPESGPLNNYAYWLMGAEASPRADVRAVMEWIVREARP